MSYQVLARKWRPRSFREMVGQEHVLKALINALDSQRLHHAYLFTGTRGVGKTTIARIMAKCLNCEQGVTSSPCGECSICREIDEGRFVDLIEVDAASKTKVEDTRELLDNVQYMPSRGRYKVYLIDEVHMLSTSSFNALLKTLEEPPPHVKFLLATTDPQKLPPTVLSRCLQFSLKNMLPEAIVGHLAHVLGSEQIPFEEQALWLLGRAADGSMRDAMSLTDQAVAFGEGKVLVEDVRAMLGTLDHGQVYGLLQALFSGDAPALLQAMAALAEQGPDWQGVLAEVLNVLHRIAVAQVMPEAVDNAQGDREQVLQLARALPAEDTQFYYQVALLGRRDLPLAPDARGGFEMVLLRMLAFRPAGLPGAPAATPVFSQPKSSVAERVSAPDALAVASPEIPVDPTAESVESAELQEQSSEAVAEDELAGDGHQDDVPAAAEPETQAEEAGRERVEPVAPEKNEDAAADIEPESEEAESAVAPPDETATVAPEATSCASESEAVANEQAVAAMPADTSAVVAQAQDADLDLDSGSSETDSEDSELDAEHAGEGMTDYLEYMSHVSDDAADDDLAILHKIDLKPHIPPATGLAARWIELCRELDIAGMTASIASNCALVGEEGSNWQMQLDKGQSALFTTVQQQRINEAINNHLGQTICLNIEVAEIRVETPALNLARRRHQQQLEAEASLERDPVIQALRDDLGAVFCADTIKPLNPI